jgi:endoglucanase
MAKYHPLFPICIVVWGSLHAAPSLAGAVQERIASPPFVRGVNLAGAEFGRALPGRANFDYAWPPEREIGAYASRGVTIIRLPFRWERLQPELGREFDSAESRRLDDSIRSITGKGIICLIDPHNYGSYRVGQKGYPIGSPEVPVSAFVDLWKKLATRYKDNPRVWFGLMNEPKGIPPQQWRDSVQATVNAIRETGAKNKVLVPGIAYSTASTWITSGNASAMQSFVDPGNNFAFEVHQYLDGNSSGTSGKCTDGAGSKRLRAFEDWLKSLPNSAKGFLGEFAGGDSTVAGQENCGAELTSLVNEVEQNKAQWVGWTVWGGGSRWPPNYFFRLEAAPRSPSETNLMRFYEGYWKIK